MPDTKSTLDPLKDARDEIVALASELIKARKEAALSEKDKRDFLKRYNAILTKHGVNFIKASDDKQQPTQDGEFFHRMSRFFHYHQEHDVSALENALDEAQKPLSNSKKSESFEVFCLRHLDALGKASNESVDAYRLKKIGELKAKFEEESAKRPLASKNEKGMLAKVSAAFLTGADSGAIVKARKMIEGRLTDANTMAFGPQRLQDIEPSTVQLIALKIRDGATMILSYATALEKKIKSVNKIIEKMTAGLAYIAKLPVDAANKLLTALPKLIKSIADSIVALNKFIINIGKNINNFYSTVTNLIKNGAKKGGIAGSLGCVIGLALFPLAGAAKLLAYLPTKISELSNKLNEGISGISEQIIGSLDDAKKKLNSSIDTAKNSIAGLLKSPFTHIAKVINNAVERLHKIKTELAQDVIKASLSSTQFVTLEKDGKFKISDNTLNINKAYVKRMLIKVCADTEISVYERKSDENKNDNTMNLTFEQKATEGKALEPVEILAKLNDAIREDKAKKLAGAVKQTEKSAANEQEKENIVALSTPAGP